MKKTWSYMKIDDENIRVGSYKGDEEEVEVPETIEDILVTAIYSGAFSPKSQVKPDIKEKRKAIRKISMSNWIESIDIGAFEGCENLEEIILSKNLVRLGSKAFKGCSRMKMVQLPDSISYISEELFMNCTSLEKIIIPKNVTEIRKKAFYNCKNLKELVLPEGIVHIGTEALKGVNLNIVKTQPGSFAEEFIANLQGKNQ